MKKNIISIDINKTVNSFIDSFPYNKDLTNTQRNKLFKTYKKALSRNKNFIKPVHVVLNMLDFFMIADGIINTVEYQKRKKFMHHGDETVYDHSIRVAFCAYNIAKALRYDSETIKNIVIAGLLHDFYSKPWQDDRSKVTFFKQHGFVHAKEACENAIKYYPEYMNKRIINAIKRHMFPLNITLPRYVESWIISFSDKIVSTSVFKDFKNPKNILLYVGLVKRDNKNN